MIDGHTFNENFYGQSFLENVLGLNLENVKKIEIIQRSRTVLYGTGAMLAEINIITKWAESGDEMKLTNEIGSYGKFVEKAYWNKSFKNNLNISISGQMGDTRGQNLEFDQFHSIIMEFQKIWTGIKTMDYMAN